MKYYLAYGSNLNKTSMQSRCPDATMFGKAMIHGYRLTAQGSIAASFFTIVPDKSEAVPVGVWEISDKDEADLDFYEGFPDLYRKETITVEVDCFDGSKKSVEALVYIMNRDSFEVIPRQYYLEICERGYKDFDLDLDYLDKVVKRLEKENQKLGARIPWNKVYTVNSSGSQFSKKGVTVSTLIRNIIENDPDCFGAITVLTKDDHERFPTVSYSSGKLSGGRCKNFEFLDEVVSGYTTEESLGGIRKDYFLEVSMK